MQRNQLLLSPVYSAEPLSAEEKVKSQFLTNKISGINVYARYVLIWHRLKQPESNIES